MYLKDANNYATIAQRGKTDPSNHWTVSWVTGHKYHIHWGYTGLNFENIKFQLAEHWAPSDRDIWVVHNFSDVRAAIDV
jgi:hypothetical protein